MADFSQTLARTTKASLINRKLKVKSLQLNTRQKVGHMEYNIMRELNVNEVEKVSGGMRFRVDSLVGWAIESAGSALFDYTMSGGPNSTNTITLDGASDGVRWGTRP